MLISQHSWLRFASNRSNLFQSPFHLLLGLVSQQSPQRRNLLTLAIETSCDDTSVAVLEKHNEAPSNAHHIGFSPYATLHFHEKITADNSQFRGIHPIAALESHQQNLATLIAKALPFLPLPPLESTPLPLTIPIRTDGKLTLRQKPTFISVTRGPGMRGSLSTGLNTAKGLSIAWQCPLLAVNHMQAHALTPRLVSALDPSPAISPLQPTPKFPYLTLLVSGGHTLLVHSLSLTHHAILSSTVDVAIGDLLDKSARCILPDALLRSSGEIMYGRLLERFAFPGGGDNASEHSYRPPRSRGEEVARRDTRWGWSLPVPLAEKRTMELSFSGLGSAVQRICGGGHVGGSSEGEGEGEEERRRWPPEERVELAREVMRVAFEHLAGRTVMALDQMSAADPRAERSPPITTLVVSGGVAANRYMQTILRAYLHTKGHAHIQLVCPPPALCTDNAAMIAWTGLEMYEAGWESKLSCTALRKWSVDPAALDGGILGVDGWVKK